ncbi:hypothetical protein DD509_05725 [Dehalogenimonas alkenigignens]|nr:hypothetical protein DD509_05725 [Dehalogenimonas alkenigignens]
MGAMNIPRLLGQLQDADLAADACREQIGRISAELNSDALAPERAALENMRDSLKNLNHQLRETTAQADDLTSRIQVYEEKLYSGRITSPKELSTLQKDIELLKGHRAPHEDRALELMEAIDAAEDGIARAEATLQRHKEALEVRRRELGEKLQTIGAELSGHEARRAALLSEIPAEAAEQYRLLRQQKGRAVARVEQGACRGCGIAVTSAWLHRARTGEIVRCTNCARILYLE